MNNNTQVIALMDIKLKNHRTNHEYIISSTLISDRSYFQTSNFSIVENNNIIISRDNIRDLLTAYPIVKSDVIVRALVSIYNKESDQSYGSSVGFEFEIIGQDNGILKPVQKVDTLLPKGIAPSESEIKIVMDNSLLVYNSILSNLL